MPEEKKDPTAAPNPAANAKPDVFSVFTCPRSTAKVVTPGGFSCNFFGGQHITKVPEHIEFLTDQIKGNHLPGFGIGDKITSDDLDPNLARKRKALQELLSATDEEQAKLVAGIRNFGESDAGKNLLNSATTADKLGKLAAMLDGKAAPAAK